ncbi:hypothetical protein I553_2342 [Mycobacterium xenopi 4042]|uniref:DUF6542 domain-containing protein n=1 Tax=Mycobacterium xenopi 4042 TaxID=1299334 RepID=X8ANW7_MYCXE|nr:hypothetical protein I553_2342 [Mycobacterium xenopi 4042]
MSAQRARSGVAADRRSIHPNIPGVPWWAAVVIAVTATAVGFAYDAGSGNKELTIVFAALYVVGCVAAVLAVRQSGVFTAVTQPPLILFCAVPGAYWLFHGAKIAGAKDILINCGYPLIERFPLMLFTSAAVLLLGMVRWYAGTAARAKTQPDDASGARRGWLAAKFAALGSRNTADGAEKTGPPGGSTQWRGRNPPNRPAALGRQTPGPTRSRHARPPLDEQPESAVERTRRRRPYPPAIPTCAVSRRGRSAAIRIHAPAGPRPAAAASTRTSPWSPMNRSGAARHRMPPTAPPRRITPFPGSAIEERPAATRPTPIGEPARAGRTNRRLNPGSTTSDAALSVKSGPADLSRQGEHQRLVGGGHRLHHVVAVFGQPLQHTAHQHLGHRGARGDPDRGDIVQPPRVDIVGAVHQVRGSRAGPSATSTSRIEFDELAEPTTITS